MIPKDRQQMAQFLEERMAGTYSSLEKDQELEPEISLVKSYLVEASLPESAKPNEAFKALKEVASALDSSRKSKVEVHRAKEPTLATLETQIKQEHVFAYIDFTNSRYWVVHSMASSTSSDTLLDRIIGLDLSVDRAWLPADMLETIARLGSLRGLGLDYDRREIPDVDFEDPTTPVEFLKMQLWGNKASSILRILREENAFPHETTLSKVKIKFTGSSESSDKFALCDVKYDGKLTARGTSFSSHIALLSDVTRTYSANIRKIEQDFAIRPSITDKGLRVDGLPITFNFEKPIAKLDIFCDRVFSASDPFRLWGVPVPAGANAFRVEAVDLHVGSPILFELTREFIRMYLPKGSCGNTVLRFYTNLQHCYDSLVKATAIDGDPAFAF